MLRAASLFSTVAICYCATQTTLTVSSQQKFEISDLLYSVFFETEIGFGCEGGLYAELLPNRDFETLGRGRIPTAPGVSIDEAPPPIPGKDAFDFRPWQAVNGAKIATSNATAPFAVNPTVLSLTATAPGQGISNPGYWGVGVREPLVGFNFTAYVYRSDDGIAELQPQLVATASETVLTNVSVPLKDCPVSSWCFVTASLPAATSVEHPVHFELIIAQGQGNVLLDHVSLMPKDAILGLFRPDLYARLAELNPGFMRMPGGNYLEGYTYDTRWNWETALYQRQNRSGHYNSAWGYWVTDGVGLYELLVLTELLRTQPQVSIYTGYSMGKPYIPMNQSQQFVDSALNLIEFANGNVSTPFGSLRASMGHPLPFDLQRLEVGNEERLFGPGEYPDHYRLITSAVWEKYPDMTIVASGRWGDTDSTGNPCVTPPVQRCDLWDDHMYESADEMARRTHLYDNYNRSWPKVFVGEYAANHDRTGSIQAGLGEAAFLLGLEANSDVVKASSFAPLFNHVKGQNWHYDLINFNSTHMFALPSFYVQTMLSQSAQGYTVEFEQDSIGAYRVVASYDPRMYTFHIKMVNYNATALRYSIKFADGLELDTTAHVDMLHSEQGPEAFNTLDNPTNVATQSYPVSIDALQDLEIPAWSLVVVHVVCTSCQV